MKCPRKRPQPLWLCAHLPGLSLEVLGLPDDRLAAVVDDRRGRASLHAVTPKAAEHGLVPGMPLSAACMLCPELRTVSRDIQREQRAMKALAERSLAFTPWVSLDFPESLLLEVRGSLKLFGGLEILTGSLRKLLADLGHKASCAAAPAPFAGWLLARNRRETAVEQPEALRSVLGDLPAALLGCDERTHDRLLKAGLSTLRDLWRMPRDGLARRYGTALLTLLDRASGDRAMPLRQFRSPPKFRAFLELPAETEHLAYFFPAIEKLIGQLAEFLGERDAAVTRVRLVLSHRDRPSTCIRQGSRQPQRNAAQLMLLLRERLDRLALPAPVSAVELSSESIVPRAMVSADLFAEQDSDPAEWRQLLDQLQARLGRETLRHLQITADHRPERAWREADKPGETSPVVESRPLWLLPRPRLLARGEVKTIRRDAERIESGWWDGAAVGRDYHVATDRRGVRLWVYRDLQAPERWYVHGFFG